MSDKIIWIGNDHGGVQLKNQIVKYFSEKGYQFKNIGTDNEEIVRYPYYAESIAAAVADKVAERGILICSTGIGMSIAANKFIGIRAALCTSTYMARMTRLHNDSNILCLGGQMTGKLEAFDIIETWLTTKFEGGRHCISLGLISEIENKLLANAQYGKSAMTQRL